MVKQVKRLRDTKRQSLHLIVGWTLVLAPFIIFGLGHFIALSGKDGGKSLIFCASHNETQILHYQVLFGRYTIFGTEGNRDDYTHSRVRTLVNPAEATVCGAPGRYFTYTMHSTDKLYLW